MCNLSQPQPIFFVAFSKCKDTVNCQSELVAEFLRNYTFACFLQDGWGYDFRRNLSVAWEDYGHYATDLFTDEAVSIIQKHSDAANASPLFLYLAHLAVHSAK